MFMKYDAGSLSRILRIMDVPYMPGVPGHNGHIIIIYCNNGKVFRIQNLHVGITRCQVLVNQVMKFWQQELSNRSYINLIKKSSFRTFSKCSERGFFMSSLFMLLIRYKLRPLHLQIRLYLRHPFCQCWLSYHHRPHT